MSFSHTYNSEPLPSIKMQEELACVQLGNSSPEDLHRQIWPYDKKISRAVFKDKHVVFIGDSLTRAMYKDLLLLIQTEQLNSPEQLKCKNEESCHGDRQIDILPLEKNRVFQQAREFQSNHHLIQYFFTTRAMRQELEKTLLVFENNNEKPDIVVMNSAIWDISRFHTRLSSGEKALEEEIETIDEYLNRVAMVCRRMRLLLPPTSMFIWLLMPNINKSRIDRGFLFQNRLSFFEIRMRLLEANMRAASVVREAGFDVLDLSFFTRMSSFQKFRTKDGVHWDPFGVRYLNQLLIGHIVAAKRIDRAVEKRWDQKVVEIIDKNNRGAFFKETLLFLRNMNRMKQESEMTMQLARNLIFKREEIQKMFERKIVFLRTLLFFKSYDKEIQSYLKMLRKGRIENNEYLVYSKDDIDILAATFTEMKKEWIIGKGQRMIMLTNSSQNDKDRKQADRKINNNETKKRKFPEGRSTDRKKNKKMKY